MSSNGTNENGHLVAGGEFISYAQNCEDVILWRALGNVDSGFYVDVGANDPVVDSVTKAFYDQGWHGINIEPVQYWHERLVSERPRDINLRVGASSVNGIMKFYEVEDTGLSTAKPESIPMAQARGFRVSEMEIEVRTLDDIITYFSPPQIHFLKIDVEGMEREVLEGIDLSLYRPWIIVVEATEPAENPAMAQETQDQWEGLLTGLQYTFVYFDGLNRFYVAEEYGELCDAFRYPPSHLIDGFITYGEHQLREELAREKEAEIQLREELAKAKESEHQFREEYESRLTAAKNQIFNLEQEVRSRQTELSAIYASTSWRITKPIRVHTPTVSKLRRIYKRSFLYHRLSANSLSGKIDHGEDDSMQCHSDAALRMYDVLKWHISSKSRNLSGARKGDSQLKS